MILNQGPMLKKQEVKHVADLARLDLNQEELDLMSGQLSDVLGYIETLKEVDTTNVVPTAQVTGLENVVRQDEIEVWDEQELGSILGQAPDSENGEIKVRRVLE